MLTCLAAPCQFRLLRKGHVKLLRNSYSHLSRIAKEIVHFTQLCLGGLHGDLRILHLQLWNCTWQPPILTASSSFPIKAGMNTRNSIRKLPILTGGATSYIVLSLSGWRKIAKPLSSPLAASIFDVVPSQHLSSLALSAQHSLTGGAEEKMELF